MTIANDLALTSSVATLPNDIYFDVDGNLVLTEDDQLTAQRWRQTLETQTNEWAFDREKGIDYLGQVMVKDPSLTVIRAMFVDVTTAVPGIKEVSFIDLNTNDVTRRLIVTIRALSDQGNPIDMSGVESDGDFVWIQV